MELQMILVIWILPFGLHFGKLQSSEMNKLISNETTQSRILTEVDWKYQCYFFYKFSNRLWCCKTLSEQLLLESPATMIINTTNTTSEEKCVFSCFYDNLGCLAVNVITTNDAIRCEMTTGLSNETDMVDDSTSVLYVVGRILIYFMWPLADPDFLDKEHQFPRWGYQRIFWPDFPWKLHINGRKWASREFPWHPLGSLSRSEMIFSPWLR